MMGTEAGYATVRLDCYKRMDNDDGLEIERLLSILNLKVNGILSSRWVLKNRGKERAYIE
jgi:hypothetical protein